MSIALCNICYVVFVELVNYNPFSANGSRFSRCLKRRYRCLSHVFTVNFEHISHIFLVFVFLTLSNVCWDYNLIKKFHFFKLFCSALKNVANASYKQYFRCTLHKNKIVH